MSNERVLAGRATLVTGGTGALGRAVAQRFVAAGADVHVTWRSEDEADAFVRFMGDAAKRVSLHQTDLMNEDSVAQLFGTLQRLDVLANVAGGFAMASLGETNPRAWRHMMELNATTAFLCAHAALPLFKASGRGRIINVASAPALERGAAKMSAYAASKAAVLNLTYSLSKELVADRITVNAIVPSVIDTPGNRDAMPNADRSTWLTPEEIAEVVLFLASDAAGIVTGSAVNLSKG